MKVLMLNPPFLRDFCRSARWAAKSRGRVQRHPDWMLIAVAALERAGHEVRFIDAAALNMPREMVEKEIRQFSPDLSVLHTTTPSIYSDIEWAGLAKQCAECRTVLVGPHVTAEPEDTFAHAGGIVDIVVRGEYDEALVDIANDKPREAIEGISFQDGSAVKHNADRSLMDIADQPFPAWTHIDPHQYRDAGKRFPFLTLISGRGCVGRCSFCRDTSLMSGTGLRLRDPGIVVDEIEYDLKLFPDLKEIMFETESFTASASHVAGVCDEVLRRRIQVTWSCNTRVDMDLSILPIMKQAGCRMLMTGFEFGTQKALDAVDKGVTLEQSRRFAEAAKKAGLIIHGCFMIGAPGETRESARATIDFAKSLPLDTIQVSGICVYPGTPMYTWAKDNGYLVPSDWREWVGPDGEQVTLLNYPQLSKKEIDELIDVGLKEFYVRPRQIARMMLSLRTFSDIRRKAFGFRSFVNYFRYH